MKKHTGKIIAGIAAVLLIGSFVYSSNVKEAANEGISFTENVKGNPDAAVVLTEYSDFQCPACAAAVPVVEQIMADYGDELRFEYQHFPLYTIHPYAIQAAVAAEAAGQQGEFFAMHDVLFEQQSAWSNASNPRALFIQYANELELDMDMFKRHLNASVIEDKVRDEFAAAQAKGYTGTPTFELNGVRLEFNSYAELIEQIDAAIAADGGADAAAVETEVEFGI